MYSVYQVDNRGAAAPKNVLQGRDASGSSQS